MSYAAQDKVDFYPDWHARDFAEASQPFATAIADTANSFIRWGARILDGSKNFILLRSEHVDIGGTTFGGIDFNLHSDFETAASMLTERTITLRFLCVSSRPADFIDLTKQKDMGAILDRHRIDNGRFYQPELLTQAQEQRQVLSPNPWDIVLFDGLTPHNPMGAIHPNQRILQTSNVWMQLPPDWRERVKRGDAPKLQPA